MESDNVARVTAMDIIHTSPELQEAAINGFMHWLHVAGYPITQDPSSRDSMVELAGFMLSDRFTSLDTPNANDAARPGEIVWGTAITKAQLIKRLNLIHYARCELSIDLKRPIHARDVQAIEKEEEMLGLMLAYMAHKCSEHLVEDLGMETALKLAGRCERFYRIKRRELQTGRNENGDLIGDEIQEFEKGHNKERKNMTATCVLIGGVLVSFMGFILGWTVWAFVFLWLLMTPLVFYLEG